MANEKEIKQLETLIADMTSASNALVTVYATASLTLKYMADDLEVILADLKGRTNALDAGYVPGPGESAAQHRQKVIEKMNANHQAEMAKIQYGSS